MDATENVVTVTTLTTVFTCLFNFLHRMRGRPLFFYAILEKACTKCSVEKVFEMNYYGLRGHRKRHVVQILIPELTIEPFSNIPKND